MIPPLSREDVNKGLGVSMRVVRLRGSAAVGSAREIDVGMGTRRDAARVGGCPCLIQNQVGSLGGSDAAGPGSGKGSRQLCCERV